MALIRLVLKAVDLGVALVGKGNTCTAEKVENVYRHLKSHLSQVNVSSGQEERVREMKELGEGAGSLPHTPASGPE